MRFSLMFNKAVFSMNFILAISTLAHGAIIDSRSVGQLTDSQGLIDDGDFRYPGFAGTLVRSEESGRIREERVVISLRKQEESGRVFAKVEIGLMHFEEFIELDPSSNNEKRIWNIRRYPWSYGNYISPAPGKIFEYQLIEEQVSENRISAYSLICKNTDTDPMKVCKSGTEIFLASYISSH